MASADCGVVLDGAAEVAGSGSGVVAIGKADAPDISRVGGGASLAMSSVFVSSDGRSGSDKAKPFRSTTAHGSRAGAICPNRWSLCGTQPGGSGSSGGGSSGNRTPKLATITAIGGSTAATMLITTAIVVE